MSWRRSVGGALTCSAFTLLLCQFVASVAARVLVQLDSLARLELPGWLERTLATYWMIVAGPNMTYATPLLLWAGVMYLSRSSPHA